MKLAQVIIRQFYGYRSKILFEPVQLRGTDCALSFARVLTFARNVLIENCGDDRRGRNCNQSAGNPRQFATNRERCDERNSRHADF